MSSEIETNDAPPDPLAGEDEQPRAALPTPATTAHVSEKRAPAAPTATAAHGSIAAHRRWLGPLFALVLILRAAIPFVAHDGLRNRDPDGYWRLAKNLWKYDTFGTEYVPTAYRPPLYPILLAPAVALGENAWLAIAALHAVMGLLSLLLIWDLARDLAPEAAWLAALLVAWDPILVRWSAEIMTETLATFLAILFWLWCMRAAKGVISALVTGIVTGMAALTRPTFLAVLPAAVLLAYFTARTRSRGVLYGGLLLLGSGVLLVPWWLRNERAFHRFVPATTHGGYTLYLGNNPEFYAHLDQHGWHRPWSSEQFDRQVIERRHTATLSNEVDHDRAEYALAWQAIRAAPLAFARACLFRLSRLWGAMPRSTSPEETVAAGIARWTIGGYYTAVLLLAVAGLAALLRHGPPADWLPGLLLLACFTLVHSVFWSDMRMRAPLVPVVAMLAAYALCPATWSKNARAPGQTSQGSSAAMGH